MNQKITLNDIRGKFLKYMESKGNVIVPSSRLVPENDPTTLFTGSGMQPIIPYLLGATHPLGKKICNSQMCFRSQDIEEVGDNRHTTFFEMLGNWSFGDYFKKEQIEWMYNFLTDKEVGLGIDSSRLYFTCYIGNEKFVIQKDTISADKWIELISQKENKNKSEIKTRDCPDANDIGEEMRDGERIFFYPDKKNWWSRSGVPENMPVGEPGGPDSEMFYDLDPNNEKGIHQDSDFNKIACHPNCDCGRFMEIGNNVFMQFQKTENGVEELKQQNVDFGGGLERLSAAANDDGDMFNLDVFDGAKNKLEELTGEKYVSDIAITWTDTDSKTFAYRVILDHIRAATFLIADGVLPGNKDREYFVKRLIRRAVRYAHNLNINNNWTKDIANTYIEYYKDVEYGIGSNLLKNRELILNELDKEESKFRKTLENGIKEFEKIIEKVKNNNSGMLDPKEYLNGKTFFDLYQTFGFPFELSIEEFKRHKSELKDFIQHFGIDFEKGLEREFLQEKELHSQSSKTASAGMFKGGLADSSEITTAYHSVTHIMFAGMRKVLGETHQAGSNINAERLRFDFTFDRKLEDDEVKKIEDYVNNAIQSGFVVETIEMDKNLAKESGVEGSFWDKYPDIVKVWTMRNTETGEIYSKELCGGPHVNSSEDFLKNKIFKITKQESASNGVRRVKGVLV